MEDKEFVLCDIVMKFIKEIPLSDLLVGIVVPIVAAWISYYLAERSIRKKENNRLYVQIELIRRELKENDFQINKFITYMAEKNKIEEELQFPFVFSKSFLIDVLDELQLIKTNYIYRAGLAFEHPSEMYILAQQLEDIKSKINELECGGYSDDFLDERRKIKILELMEAKEEKIDKFEKLKERNIYIEFLELQSMMEHQSIGKMFEKSDVKGENFYIIKYIYESIKAFNEKPTKTKEDASALCKKLVIFEIDTDIIEKNFDQDTSNLYCKVYTKTEGIEKNLYNLCDQYYKYNVLKKMITNHKFEFQNRHWIENNADFVIINDRNLYISIVELYDKLKIGMDVSGSENYEEKNKCSIEWHNEIQDIIAKLEQHEKKLQKKCN